MHPIPRDAFLLIIGAMRSGTSTVFRTLAQHPRVCPSVVKEPEFFAEVGRDPYPVERYEDLWEFDPGTHAVAMEASTAYTKYPSEGGVPERIRRYGIRPRFVYVVRDPIDRVESHFNHERTKPHYDRRLTPVADRFVSLSDYYLQLEQYRPVFPRDRILVQDFIALRGDALPVYETLARFLAIDTDGFPPAFPVRNRAQTFTNAEAFVRRSPRLRRTRDALPSPLRRIVNVFLQRCSRPMQPRRLTAGEREIIHDRLHESMRRFHAEYGFDVTRWGFDA